jgi:hypothetical protein
VTVREEVRAGGWLGAIERSVYRILTYRPDIDGRTLAAGVLALYFLVVTIPRLFGVDVWPALGVPSGPSLFFDTRNLTAALECRRLGFDPLVESPCDPWGRPLNYPRVWLVLRFLGLNQSHTVAVALVFIALFFVAVSLLMGRITLGRGALLAVALCSPSVMFAIERANLDIVVFTLMVAAMLLWRTERPWAQALSPIVVLIGATAKIYPVFGLPAYLFLRRRVPAIVASVCLVVFAVYAAITLNDIQAVARVAPQGQHYAFGARILPVAIYHLVVPDRWQGGLVSKQVVVILPALAIGAVIWFLGRRRLPPEDEAADTAIRLAFFVGALIFLGTFAVGNNFDYRLVFTLLTLPQLFEWATVERGGPRGRLAAVSIVALLALLWIGALSEPLRLGDEVVTWVVVGLMIALLGASVPRLRAVWSAVVRPTITAV